MTYLFERKASSSLDNNSVEVVARPLEAVAALGQLQPAGKIRKLAAPISGFGGTPRISTLNVKEGDFVRVGDVLAVFDNRPQILSDLARVDARIQTLDIKIKIQKKQVSRYTQAALQGATSLVLLEEKEDQLVKLIGQNQLIQFDAKMNL